MHNKQFPALLSNRKGWSNYLDINQPSQPHVHQIEPTNHCPYRCVMCPRTKKMTRELGFMDLGLYRRIIDEIASFAEPVRSKEIELFHFGESLLHPEIDEMVGYATHYGLRTVLSVNAPQLTPDVAAKILENKPYKLIISLDGHDEKTYREIRGKAAKYQLAVSNIENLIKVIDNSHYDTQVCLRIIRLNANETNLDEFCQLWQEKGIEVEVRPFFPWTEKEMAVLGKVDKYPPGMPCPFPWQYLVVQWDGTVVPCCRDFNGINAVGNVTDSSLQQIWDSDAYRNFRLQHQTGRYGENHFCHDCMEIFYTPAADDRVIHRTCCAACQLESQGQVLLSADWMADLHAARLINTAATDDYYPLDQQQTVALFWSERLCCLTAVADKMKISLTSLEEGLKPLRVAGILELSPFIQVQGQTTITVTEQTFTRLWHDSQQRFSDTTLLINDTDGSTFSYADADEIVQMVARRLAAMGVSRGDRIVSCSSQHVEALLTCWAALMLGAVFVPLDHNLQKTTFGEIVGETAPKLVLCDFASWEKFADREELVIFDDDDDLPLTGNLVRFSEWLEQDSANEPAPYVQEPDDPAVILYTSGTSGRPKGVLLSHAALYCSGALMANAYSWNTDDILFSLGDYHTMSGLRNPCIASLFGGCSVVVASPASRCNALVVADCVTRHQATLLGSVPATIRQFNKFADRVGKQLLASLRQVICTGSVLTTEVAKEFETAYGLVVYNYYGLTETAGLCIGCTPDTQFDNPATVGKPLNCLVRIEDSAGKQLGSKQIGELLIYPANRMDGYYLNPELTNQVFENGWYRTGDFAMLEADGAVVLYGRSSDIVKNSSGDLINPQVVETIMEGLQEVAEAGVCGNVDASGEEYLTVFVVPSCAVDDEEQWLYALKAEAYKELGFLKMPYWLKRISALPVNSNGKLLRGQLKLLLSEEDV